jgi:hypothetical protein
MLTGILSRRNGRRLAASLLAANGQAFVAPLQKRGEIEELVVKWQQIII